MMMVCKLVLGRYGVLIQKVLLVVPMGFEAPGSCLVQVVLNGGGDDGGILRQTQGDFCGMKLLGESLSDGLPQAMDFDIGT